MATVDRRRPRRQTLAALHRRGEATHPRARRGRPGPSSPDGAGARQVVLEHPGRPHPGAAAPRVRRCRSCGPGRSGRGSTASTAGRRWTTGFPAGITGMDPCEASAALVDRWLHALRSGDHGRRPVVDGVERPRHEAGAGRRRRGPGRGRRSVAGRSSRGGSPPKTPTRSAATNRGSRSCPGLDPTTMGWKQRRLVPRSGATPYACSTPTGTADRRSGSTGASSGAGCSVRTARSRSGGSESVAARRRRQVEIVGPRARGRCSIDVHRALPRRHPEGPAR